MPKGANWRAFSEGQGAEELGSQESCQHPIPSHSPRGIQAREMAKVKGFSLFTLVQCQA